MHRAGCAPFGKDTHLCLAREANRAIATGRRQADRPHIINTTALATSMCDLSMLMRTRIRLPRLAHVHACMHVCSLHEREQLQCCVPCMGQGARYTCAAT